MPVHALDRFLVKLSAQAPLDAITLLPGTRVPLYPDERISVGADSARSTGCKTLLRGSPQELESCTRGFHAK